MGDFAKISTKYKQLRSRCGLGFVYAEISIDNFEI
jgi:hypothetical protein